MRDNSVVAERINEDLLKRRTKKIQDHKNQNREFSKIILKPRSRNAIEIKMAV
jgi:hypothetical protein